MSPDPLVQLWRTTTRPLNWQPWLGLSAAKQARLRWMLCCELLWLEVQGYRDFHWRDAHRELLELKAACGHQDETEGQPDGP